MASHTTAPTDEEWRGKLIRATVRHDQALLDHAEADAARELVDSPASASLSLRRAPSDSGDLAGPEPDEPVAIDFDAPFPDYDAEAI